MRNKRFVVLKPPICFENYRRRYVEMCYANYNYDELVTDDETCEEIMNYDEYYNDVDTDDSSLELDEQI